VIFLKLIIFEFPRDEAISLQIRSDKNLEIFRDSKFSISSPRISKTLIGTAVRLLNFDPLNIVVDSDDI